MLNKYILLLLFIGPFMVSCTAPDDLYNVDQFSSQKIYTPLVMESKHHISFDPSQGIFTFSHEDPESVSVNMIYNSKNVFWGTKDILFDRFSPYGIAGEIVPAFNDDYSRNVPFNILHLYHSIFLRYYPKYMSTGTYDFFQFSFIPDWQAFNWFPVNTKSGEIPFDSGDTIRYFAYMDHTDNRMNLYIKNTNNDYIAYNFIREHDFPYRPPTNLRVPIREIYIGTGSHGNYYEYDGNDFHRESFFGDISKTLLLQGKFTKEEIEGFLLTGNTILNDAEVLFDQANINPVVLLPLTGWTAPDAILRLGGEAQHWTDIRQTLKFPGTTISYDASKHYLEKDLETNILEMSIRSNYSENVILQFIFHSEKMKTYTLNLSKVFSERTQNETAIQIPFPMIHHQWQHIYLNIRAMTFQDSSFTKKEELYLDKISINGDGAVADIIIHPDMMYLPQSLVNELDSTYIVILTK